MKKLLSIVLITLLITTSLQYAVFANEEIKVVIDGEKLNFDVAPQIINGRTMVPLRGIFEYFGADITWNADKKSINSFVGNVRIHMKANNPSAYINGVPVNLDSPPVIIDGRTLVPARVIAEAFYAKVSWDGDTKTVIIETPYPKNKNKASSDFDKYHLRTSASDFEYFDFSINGNKLEISGKLLNEEKDSILIKIGETEKVTDADKNRFFNITLDLDSAKINEFALLSVYSIIPGSYSYKSYTFNTIKVVKDSSGYSFSTPIVYDNNIHFTEKWVTPLAYTNYKVDERIINLSNEICNGIDTDYEKLKALHTWVCENIYYDYDYFYNKSTPSYYTDVDVMEYKRTVCAGYANLMRSLVRAQGIPARGISGYALGLGSNQNYWTDTTAGITTSNHLWLQAYVDDHWINLDPTWDSQNKYENGNFIYGGLDSYLHFDTSDAMIAMDHKILEME